MRGHHAPKDRFPPVTGVALGLLRLLATPVGEVAAHCEKYDGKVVVVSTVSGSANLLVSSRYSLADDKGQLLVITDKDVPKPGTSMVVRGKVNQAFSVGSKSLSSLSKIKP